MQRFLRLQHVVWSLYGTIRLVEPRRVPGVIGTWIACGIGDSELKVGEFNAVLHIADLNHLYIDIKYSHSSSRNCYSSNIIQTLYSFVATLNSNKTAPSAWFSPILLSLDPALHDPAILDDPLP